MIERRGERLIVTAPMVMDNARALIEAGRVALHPGEQVFDLAQVEVADSSAVAVMLGWLRIAGRTRSTVDFAHVPPGVRSLAGLYGVSELLRLA